MANMQVDLRARRRRFRQQQPQRRAAEPAALLARQQRDVDDPPRPARGFDAQPPDRLTTSQDHPPLGRRMMLGDVTFLQRVLPAAQPRQRVRRPAQPRKQRLAVREMRGSHQLGVAFRFRTEGDAWRPL